MDAMALEPDLIAGLEDSSREILESMASMSPESIETQCGSHATTSHFESEVVATLGFTGTKSGAMIACASEALTRKITAKMLMVEPEELDDFTDGFGELVNMVTGNFKNDWVAKGNEMHLAMPTVTRHGDVSIPHKAGEIHCSIRIMLEGEALDMTLVFEGTD